MQKCPSCMAEWAEFSELFDGKTSGVQGRKWVFCREDDSWGIWESGERLNAEDLVSRSILVAWSLRAHMCYILRTQLFSTCNSSSVCLGMHFLHQLYSYRDFGLFTVPWYLNVRCKNPVRDVSICLYGTGLHMSEFWTVVVFFNVLCCKEVFPWWGVSTAITFGYKDRYLECSLAVCLLVKGQL